MRVPSKRPEHCSGFSFFKSDQDGRKGKDEGVVSYARSCAVDCAKGRMTMLDRREFMKICSGMGLAGTLFPGVLWAQAQAESAKKITKVIIYTAPPIAGVPLADQSPQSMGHHFNAHSKGSPARY